MDLYKVGDKSKAICPFCEAKRTTTFEVRDVPLSSGKGRVRDLLVAVCNTCDRVVAIPQQSVPRIKDTIRYSRHPVEARIPRHLSDALALACHRLGSGPESSAVLFRHYLVRVSRNAHLKAKLTALSSSDEARGRATARFSAKLNDDLFAEFQRLAKISNLNKAALVKAIIVLMKRDILDKKRKDLQPLKEILQVAA